jgi:hypothetical protein
MIEHSLTEWAQSLGVDRKTISAALSKAGIAHEPGAPLTAMAIKTAILGDEKAEKVRNLKLDGDQKEHDLAVAKKLVYDPAIVQAMVDAVAGYNRQALLQARAELPPRCNPQNPKVALTAIDQWLDRFWPAMREAIAKEVA